MIRLKRVLLPTDFSDFAGAAADYACDIAERFEAELHVLHVFEDFVAVVSPELNVSGLIEDFVAQAEAAARQRIKSVPGDAWGGKLPVVRVVRAGFPFAEVIRYSREAACDLIVMGTHGRTGMAHLFLGSVAERVVRAAPCPVLTVRPAAIPAAELRMEQPLMTT